MNLKKLSSFVLIVAMVLSLIAPAALAAPAEVETFEEFLASGSDQFVLGEDSNWYTHSQESFGTNYELSDELLEQLISLEPQNTNKLSFLQFRQSAWGGSCFGIASTMVLNKLTKSGLADEGSELNIESFYPGANDYFDLRVPSENPKLRDMINYYMISQLHSWSMDYSMNLLVSEIDIDYDGEPNTLTDADYEEYGLVKVDTFIDTIKSYIDNDQPFLFCFYCSLGGHAIVGIDYFEDDGGTPSDPTDDVFYLKTFDENDVTENGDAKPAWSYLRIEKNDDGVYDPMTASLNYINHDTGEYEPIEGLYQVVIYDIAAINNYLNIENPQAPETDIVYRPTMSIIDINNVAKHLTITVEADGVSTDITFREQNGFVTPVYSDPQGKDLVNSFSYNLVIEETSSASIVFEEADKFTVSYKGNTPLYLNMSSEEGDSGSGTYSSIAAANVGKVEFDSLGQLQNMKAQTGKVMQDAELYIGTLGSEFSTDMMSITLPKCTYIEVYDWLDHFDFDDSIVIHTDGLQEGMDLLFFDGLNVIEEPLEVYSDDARDSWVKMQAESYGTTAYITLWSAFETEDGSFPTFKDKPDMTGWVGETPKDGWVALTSGHYIYIKDGDLATGPLTAVINIEEHTYLLDSEGFMTIGKVETEDGYDYYNEEGTSPLTDTLGQLVYSAEKGKDSTVFTLKDWVPGGKATIKDDVFGTIVVTDNDNSYTLCNGEGTELPFTANEDGTLTYVLDGDTPLTATIAFEANKYTITDVFSDVSPRAWYANAVKYVYSNNYMPAREEGRFVPDAPATRAEVLGLLYKMLGAAVVPEDENDIPAFNFTDVPADHPFAEAIKWAVENRIAEGVSATSFAPDAPITREQMSVYLYRVFDAVGLIPEEELEPAEYSDFDKTSDYAVDAMTWATSYTVFRGYDDGTVRPQGNTTRAECAMMSERIVAYLLQALFGFVPVS